MSNDLHASTNPQQEARKEPEDLSNRTFIAKALMWIIWILTIFSMMVLFLYAYRIDPDKDHWAIDSMVVTTLAIFMPIALALRFFIIKKVKNIWLKLITYGFGLFISELIIIVGYFAVIRGDFTLISAGAAMILLYFPASVSIAKK